MFETRHELHRIGQLLPNLRQKSAAVRAIFQHHAIHARAQLRQCIGLAGKRQGLRGRQQGDFDLRLVQFLQCQGRKAWIAQRGGQGIGFDILQQRATRLQAANAATQLTPLH